MGKKLDLTNQKFGKLTALKYVTGGYWICQCECGKTTKVQTNKLTSGHTKSCGCLRGQASKGNTRNMGPRKDITGKRFGRLTVQYYIKGGLWHCICDCGNEVNVDTRNLNSKHTQSCGCFKREIAQKNVVDMVGYENKTLKIIKRAGSTEKNQKALWECKCKLCGKIFIASGQHIRSGAIKSCGCMHSINERKIEKILNELNISYAREYTFKDLKGTRNGLLRFDFALFKNNKLFGLIEYNGAQHYIKQSGSWGKDFKDAQLRDSLKLEYCEQHNIPLLIIPYFQEYDKNTILNFYEPVETIPGETGSTVTIDT